MSFTLARTPVDRHGNDLRGPHADPEGYLLDAVKRGVTAVLSAAQAETLAARLNALRTPDTEKAAATDAALQTANFRIGQLAADLRGLAARASSYVNQK